MEGIKDMKRIHLRSVYYTIERRENGHSIEKKKIKKTKSAWGLIGSPPPPIPKWKFSDYGGAREALKHYRKHFTKDSVFNITLEFRMVKHVKTRRALKI